MTIDAKLAAKIERFEAAYAEWLEARADLAARHEDESDEATNARSARASAAEVALVATQAPHESAIWQKWELLDWLLNDERDAGPRAYPLTLIAVAALKTDISALGLKSWPEA